MQARLGKVINLLPLHPYIRARTDEPSIRRMRAAPYPYIVFYAKSSWTRSLFMPRGMPHAIPPGCFQVPGNRSGAATVLRRAIAP